MPDRTGVEVKGGAVRAQSRHGHGDAGTNKYDTVVGAVPTPVCKDTAVLVAGPGDGGQRCGCAAG